MLFTANDIEFTFSHATGILTIPVRDIIVIHIDTTYTNSLYFIYTDRLLRIKNRIHRLKYDDIESYNEEEVPEFGNLINEIKTFAPARTFLTEEITKRIIEIKIINDTTLLTPGDGIGTLTIPKELNGFKLIAIAASLSTVSSSGNTIIQVRNATTIIDMLSTPITIDEGTKNSYLSVSPPIIDPNNNIVATGNEIAFDRDVVGIGSKGLNMILTFSKK